MQRAHPGDTVRIHYTGRLEDGADLLLELSRDQRLDDVEPEVGQVYEIRNDDGSKADYRVTAVSPTEITLDANHPLAGKDLVFTVQLIEILEKD
jgi:FKBP-type peptidyl-prolyl cis-trans isomerase 2